MSTLTVSRAHLASELRFVTDGFKPSRSMPAILHGARLEYADGTLTVSTFDYEVCRSATMPASGAEPVSILVNARDLASVVGKPGPRVTGDVVFTVGQDVADLVNVSTDDMVSHLPALELADYPSNPAPATAHLATVADVSILRDVAHAAGGDDTVPILTGVKIERIGHHLSAAATDRYRLAFVDWTDDAGPDFAEPASALIPAHVVKSVVKHVWGGPVVITSHRTDTYDLGLVTFTAGNRVITARTLGGDYPRWRALVPSTSNGTLEIDGRELVDAVKAIAPMAGKLTPVRLVQGGNVLQLEVRGDVDGADAEPTATRLVTGAEYAGDIPVTTHPGGRRSMVSLTPKYLTDAIGAVGKGRITVSMTTGLKPIVISGTGPVRVLVMPIRPAGDVKHGHVSATESAA